MFALCLDDGLAIQGATRMTVTREAPLCCLFGAGQCGFMCSEVSFVGAWPSGPEAGQPARAAPGDWA